MPSPDPEKLERLIHRTLRELPDRPAPRSLAARVEAALAQRAASPWWRRSYADWPRGLRYAVLFLGVLAAAALVVVSRSPIGARAFGALAVSFPWIALLQTLGASLLETMHGVFDAIPAAWLYSGLVLLVACYALLLGLGAAVYRTFFRRPALHPLSP
jgi:hypothetical protein